MRLTPNVRPGIDPMLVSGQFKYLNAVEVIWTGEGETSWLGHLRVDDCDYGLTIAHHSSEDLCELEPALGLRVRGWCCLIALALSIVGACLLGY
jgi:hypothetical protein